jgi:hypothetical protein
MLPAGCFIAKFGGEWYNDLRSQSVGHMMMEKPRRTSYQASYLALLDSQMLRLRQVESRLDDLLRQVVIGLDEERLAIASERFDDLVLTHPDLRVPDLEDYPQQVGVLLSHFDLECGPLPGFQKAMDRLCALVITPQVVYALRSRLYKIAASAAETDSDLLATVAVASLSLDPATVLRNAFVEMVVCASAIESSVYATLAEGEPVSADVSTWLAAEPTDALVAAVGEGTAYYYASIPGVLPLLDQGRVLFDFERIAPDARTLASLSERQGGQGLNALVDKAYKAVLSGEIMRVQRVLRRRYPAGAIADAEMLARRALDALDRLPPHVNPLLQAIFVQSWVRYFHAS